MTEMYTNLLLFTSLEYSPDRRIHYEWNTLNIVKQSHVTVFPKQGDNDDFIYLYFYCRAL